jgi:cell wall-associated NlpC family hydrolase
LSPPSRICVLALALALALAVPLASGAAIPARRKVVSGAQHASAAEAPKPIAVHRRPPLPLGERAARLALREVGMPYVWGGAAPGGFDCSGLTSWVYGRLGITLPHNAAAQFAVGRTVERGRLRPGDLLFFHGLGHVGLYLGRGRMVHAPHSGRSVEVVPLAGNYASRFVGARRVGDR